MKEKVILKREPGEKVYSSTPHLSVQQSANTINSYWTELSLPVPEWDILTSHSPIMATTGR